MTGDRVPHLTARGRATRERIVRAAAELMFTQGATRTSIEDVRAKAGVSGSQMSHYFADRACLVRAVIAWQADAVVRFHTSTPLGGLDSFESLRLWAETQVELHAERGFEGGFGYGALAGQLAAYDEETRAHLAAGFERWLTVIEAGLRAMRIRGELRPEADPRTLALGLIAAFQGGVLLTQISRSQEPLASALEAAVAHVESFAAQR
jgi:TetR/AcrR family transcriptional regulator, transcriptional repressor for nem operon